MRISYLKGSGKNEDISSFSGGAELWRSDCKSCGWEVRMLGWAWIFLVIAIIAAIFGFGGIAAGAAGIAKILFFVFLVIFVISLLMGRRTTV